MKSNKYYNDLNIIRILAMLAVLLHHLNILKGGFLAVCIFFLLSSYLSCLSAFQKEKFSLLEYYKNLFLKLYLPLVIIVFITIFIVSYLPNIIWLNIKPETRSILLGYNNFWQLKANLDYFAGNINSPFTHLWYESILLQFDLIFPFIYLILKKLGDKIHKLVPIIITLIISIISIIYFCKTSTYSNIMFSYYNTFTRMFALWLGVFLGFIHNYYKPLIINKLRVTPLNKIIFYSYLIILTILFIFIDSTSPYYGPSMILTTLITLRLIDYATISINKENIRSKIFKYLSKISYEIYLLQYPIIYILGVLISNRYILVPLVIILVFIFSNIFHLALSKQSNKKVNILKYTLLIPILVLTTLGIYKYIKTPDYTIEMKALESELASNEEKLIAKEKEYASKLIEENNNWEEKLNELTNSEKEIEDIVKNLKITGVGDSVMLGAVDNLYSTFKNSYFDAKISRTAWSINDIILNLRSENILGDVIIFNLGANGDCSKSCKEEIMATCGNRKVFWLNTTNLPSVNETLNNFAKNYTNLYIIDWYNISKGHNEYFYADGIHLTPKGRVAYTNAIYEAIYNVYVKESQAQKEEAIKNHEAELKNKMTFIGNELLLNAFPNIQNNYPNVKYLINKNYTFKTLKEEIQKNIKNNTLTNKIVLTLDSIINLNKEQYEEILKLLNKKEIYIISLSKRDLTSLESSNVKIIDFYSEIEKHSEYLMIDNVHLSKKGNEALAKYISANLPN